MDTVDPLIKATPDVRTPCHFAEFQISMYKSTPEIRPPIKDKILFPMAGVLIFRILTRLIWSVQQSYLQHVVCMCRINFSGGGGVCGSELTT